MKRVLTISSVILIAIFMTLPVYAIDHQLGGDLRFRLFTAGDWSGDDNDPGKDRSQADSRAHFSYTAKINDDLKVYTLFRMNSVWGDDAAGRAGVSELTLLLKHSYIDFNIGKTNLTIGKQNFFEARGLLIYDTAPGVSVTCPLSDQFSFNAKWIKFGEGGGGESAHQDIDTIAIMPQIKLNDNITFKPYFWYVMSNEMNRSEKTWNWWWSDINKLDDLDLYYIGFDADAKVGPASLWFTALYQTGSANIEQSLWTNATFGSIDFSGIAVLGGGSLNVGKATLSAQLFYASGDDNPNDDKIEQFFSAEAGYYYWSEIMGLGSNDDDIPNNLSWSLTNIMGGGLGASICATDKITLNASLWYATAVEDIGDIEADDYGTELNIGMDYALMDNLGLSLIGAYVVAGDAITGESVPNSNIDAANPFFLQAQIQATF
ncbi:porin [Candidatus Magnetomorum sp. HK-1]|nr:porin [Candidatus Magnetomorum sp. HK-1]